MRVGTNYQLKAVSHFIDRTAVSEVVPLVTKEQGDTERSAERS
jgi:hypothetical protein